MPTTRANLRLEAARRLGLVSSITTSSEGHASGHTFVAVGLLDKFPTSLNELWVYNPSTSEERRVVNYDEPEGIAQVNRPFAAQIATSTTLYIFRRFAPSAYNDALQSAITDVYPYLAQMVVDTSLTTASEQYEYTIPSSIVSLERMDGGRVEMEVNTNDSDYPYVELRLWETREALTTSRTHTLLIHPNELVADRTLRLRGLGYLTNPSTDAATVPLEGVQATLLIYKLIANLYAQAQGAPAGDGAMAQQMEAKYLAMFEQKRDEWGIILDPTDLRPPAGGHTRDLPLAYNAEPS